MIRVVVNGQPREVEDGTPTLLAALLRLGVHVPHLCHDDRIAPAGKCRLCTVHVQGSGHALAACTTPLTPDMVVDTHTEDLEANRRVALRMLARHYPQALAGAASNPFIDELTAYGLLGAVQGEEPPPEQVDDAHPYIRVDMSRCIACYRCERICAELQGQFTWRVWNRGGALRFTPDSGTTLRASSCVSCGACADTCPSGALQDKTLLELGLPERFTRTTCPYCGVGCEMQVGVRNGRITQVRPAYDAKVNKGHLCVKGRYAFGFNDAPDRVTTPLLRGAAGFRAIEFDAAIAHVADELRRIRDTYGPQAIGVLGSARATNEDNYVAQKFARVVLGTNNVDCCARVCHAPSAAALSSMLGTGAATGCYDDIEQARTLFVFGANATENHPIVGARLRQAALAGAQLIVADPRATELAQVAALHLPLRPGTNIPLLHALAFTVVHEGMVDRDYVAARVDGYDAYARFIAAYAPERVAAECGVAAEQIRSAARLIATHRPAMFVHGLGATEHVQGTEAVQCLVNLALLTGNLGVPGAGVNPLRGQNNVQGAAHMGCEPAHLTGYAALSDAARFEQAWGAPVPRTPGLDLMQMIDAAHGQVELKALLAVGYDVLLTNPEAERTRKALAQLELVVVQDLFMTETAREVAHVFLPAASAFEKDGTFMNAERRVQRVRRAVAPPGEARTDAEILCALATALGHREGFAFASAEQIWNEVRALWPAGRGMSYARLEHGGLQWPCPSEDHPGTARLHTASFAGADARAALRCIDHTPTPEAVDDDYPLLLVTGRRLYQFNAGTMTARTRNNELQPADVLEVSPSDAERYRLASGDAVTLRSRYGSARLPVHVSSAQREGQVFATFHTASVFLNRITGPHRDRVTHTPEYKVTAVRVEVDPSAQRSHLEDRS